MKKVQTTKKKSRCDGECLLGRADIVLRQIDVAFEMGIRDANLSLSRPRLFALPFARWTFGSDGL